MNKRKIEVLFINPSSMSAKEQKLFLEKTSILRVPSFSMPIGLMDISAYLRGKFENIDIRILDIGKDLFKIYMNYKDVPPMTLESFIGSELNTVDFKPDVVGISILFSTAHNTSLLIARMVKERWKDAVIVCGGNHATNYFQGLLQNPNIDYVVRGEGELSFAEFVNKMLKNNKSKDIFGIIDMDKFRQGHGNELSPMVENLDVLPLPAFDLLDIDFYKKTVGASLMFSRGCVFNCTFCASHTVHGRKLRFKSEERIVAEFNQLINIYGFTKIVIEDDLFAAKKDRFLKVADRLSKMCNSIKFFLPQGLSVSILDEEIINAMIKMGINEAAIAIESGSEYVQKNIIKKNVALSKTKHILEYLRGKDFLIYVNFILGFPGETRSLMQETIDFIDTLDTDWVFIFHALPLPGSEIYNKLTMQGIIKPDNFDWDGLRLGSRVFDTPEISADELERLTYDINISCNFFNNSNLRHGRYQRAIDVFNRIIIEQYPFHIVGLYCRALAYLSLKEKEKATADFNSCTYWISNNKESKRLYERYNEKMPLLKKYMSKQAVVSLKKVIPI